MTRTYTDGADDRRALEGRPYRKRSLALWIWRHIVSGQETIRATPRSPSGIAPMVVEIVVLPNRRGSVGGRGLRCSLHGRRLRSKQAGGTPKSVATRASDTAVAIGDASENGVRGLTEPGNRKNMPEWNTDRKCSLVRQRGSRRCR